MTITDLYSLPSMYIAYNIYYMDYPEDFDTKYVSTDVFADQNEINVTIYGYIYKVCQSSGNIGGLHDVAKVQNMSEYHLLSGIASLYVVFLDPTYTRCTFTFDKVYKYDVDLTTSLNGYLLSIYLYTSLLHYEVDISTCQKRVFMNITPSYGIMQLNKNDVVYPVFNKALRNYGSDYGNFLYPLIFINSNKQENLGLLPSPSKPIQSNSDTVIVEESILFGTKILNELENILAGNDSRFENVTIINKCIQFYANSPRDIEYPIGSGIINSLRTEISYSSKDSVSKEYIQYFGPRICVNKYFVYIPAFFLTEEDPALKQLCDNLPQIQSNFTKHVQDGTWEYLGEDKNINNEANKQSIAYTQKMIDKLTTTCQKAYFLPNYLKNLSNAISIIAILYYISMLVFNIIRMVLTKLDQTHQYFTHICELDEWKRIKIQMSIIGVLGILTIIILVVIKQYSYRLIIILILFITSLLVQGFYQYQRFPKLNIGYSIDETNFSIKQIPVIATQFAISIVLDSLDILLTITDILQMLEYMKFQYYLNRIQNIIWLLKPANLILDAAKYLGKGVFPFIFLIVSLINQEIMKSEHFMKLIQKQEALNYQTFLMKKLLKLFSYYQSFSYNVFFAYTDTAFDNIVKNSILNSNIQVIIKMYLAGTLYSISKYNLLLEYYRQINKSVIKLLISVVQVVIDTVSIIVTPIIVLWNLFNGRWKKAIKIILNAFWAICSIIYYIIVMVLDPIITILFPTTLMLQDFMFPCPFILQLFGICDHQAVIAQQTKILLATDLASTLRRIITSIISGAVSLFFFLLFTQNQEASISPAQQWHCFIFAGAMLLTPIVCTNQIGQFIAKQQTKVVSKLASFQALLAEKHAKCHESLLSVHGNYEHAIEQCEEYFRGFIFAGYGTIPGCGPLLSCVAKFLGATCVASSGVWKFDVNIVLNAFQFVFTVLMVQWALEIDNETKYFLGWFVASIILQLTQNWKDVIEELNEDFTVGSIIERSINKLKCKKNKNGVKTELNDEIKNQTDLVQSLSENEDTLEM
ncbi:Conserved_hypothetical protein [Hexamita inflata]|uniref:Uncharacterized protein n=1 Tax=Hexamita inflata TaxID=28002 RepID=A0ABP1HE63_9EUKA